MKILVTGGAGYIGSHTAKLLSRSGHIPVVFDNLFRGNRWSVQWGEFVQGDLLDKNGLAQLFAHNSIDAVLHFAAHAYVGESMLSPEIYFRNNIEGSLNLLEAMRVAKVDKIIFSSTCAVYGIPKSLPLQEDSPTNPCNPYGESKLAVERLLHWFGKCYGIKFVALRYFNAAGCDRDGEIGECHNPETHLIPSLLHSLTRRDQQCAIFGMDYPTPDGTCIRDYIHVTDLASAHLSALNYLCNGGENETINLGTGKGFSILEIIHCIETVTGKKVSFQSLPRRAGDPAELVASAKRAFEILGWQPMNSDLNNIISTAWIWSQKLDSGSIRLRK